ncbi:DUF866-domain-containing protein, partial [Piedraia hortae CBS 480.64]
MLTLALSADLDGITDLQPAEDEWTFKIQCTSCRETHPNWVSFSSSDKVEQSKGKGEANFVWRCRNCKREHTANVVDSPKAYSDSNALKNIISFDCRGIELLEFKPDGNWKAKGTESNTPFPEIDLNDDWFDYDEKAAAEVSIKEVKWVIRKA